MRVQLAFVAAMAFPLSTMLLSCSNAELPDSVSATKPAPNVSPSDAESQNFLLIEHRGRYYRYEDLMTPTFRAESNDRFVRRFGTEIHWAGLGPGEYEPGGTLE